MTDPDLIRAIASCPNLDQDTKTRATLSISARKRTLNNSIIFAHTYLDETLTWAATKEGHKFWGQVFSGLAQAHEDRERLPTT